MAREPDASSTCHGVTACVRRSLGALAQRARAELVELWNVDPGIRPLLLSFMAVQVVAMFWDQPGFYGWENDGAAPRGLFGGIADNLTPGRADRYPLFHYVLLGLAAFPVLLVDGVVAVISGESLAHVVIGVPSMTGIALAAKLLHVAMLAVALLALCRIFATAFGRHTGRWAVAFAMVNLSVGYYGRVTNVDVAYLLWVTLFVDRLATLAREHEPTREWRLAFFAAAAVATKDQAYASLALPALLYWVVLRRRDARSRVAALARTAGLAAGWYALLSGAVFNPSGLRRRILDLIGPNSQNWRQYEASAAGLLANLRDLFVLQDDFWWPWPGVLAAWSGVLIAPLVAGGNAGADPEPLHWSYRWLPLCAGAGSVLLFTLPVGRAEHRFMLPLGFWLSGYLGLSVTSLSAWLGRTSRWPSLGGAALFVLGGGHALELLVTEWCDARRDVERHLATLAPGTEVETYGLGVYLPRFDLSSDSAYRVTRINAIGSGPPPPIRGLRELEADFAALEQRRPDVLVIPDGFAGRFRRADERSGAHPRRAMDSYRTAAGAERMFQSALADQVPNYRLLEVGQVRLPEWYRWMGGRAISVHGSTGRRVWVFQREGTAR